MLIFRWEGDIGRRPRLSSSAEERGAPPHHQPQLLGRNQRPRDGTVDVKFTFHFDFKTAAADEILSDSRVSSMCFCRIKEKFPYAFDDICLYSEVSHLLAHCMFRLTSRRFIQELFQDVQFMPVRPSDRSSVSLLV